MDSDKHHTRRLGKLKRLCANPLSKHAHVPLYFPLSLALKVKIKDTMGSIIRRQLFSGNSKKFIIRSVSGHCIKNSVNPLPLVTLQGACLE